MKKIEMLFVVSLLIFSLSSCTSKSGVSIGEVGHNTLNSISEKYISSSQTFTKNFSIKDGEIATVKVSVVTENGKIAMDIVDDKGTSIYSGNEIPTSDFEVKAEKSGKYKLTVITKEHKGGFNVTWNVDK